MDRERILAYRIAAHGLLRDARPHGDGRPHGDVKGGGVEGGGPGDPADPAALDVTALGVQDIAGRDTAASAFAARLPDPPTATRLAEDPRLTLLWSLRGAPHYHRTADLPWLRGALVPFDDADAAQRLAFQRDAAEHPRAAVLATAEALRAVVDRPTPKGRVSAEVTEALPPELCRWCRPCGATHVYDQLLRLAGPPAGVRLVPGGPTTLAPIGTPPSTADAPVPDTTDIGGLTELVHRYLRVHGPATMADVAAFLGASRQLVADHCRPDDLAEVRIGRRTTYLPADRLAALENPPEPDAVRLLPPWDPFLQSRDRATLAPDPAVRKEIWRTLGNPGVVLAGGDLAGTWRAQARGTRLDFTVTPFASPPRHVRGEVEAEAMRVATVRGYADSRTVWS